MAATTVTAHGAEKRRAEIRTEPPAISCDPTVFQQNLNKLPFEVVHRLADNPLFELPRLVELAQEVSSRQDHHRPYGDAYCLIGTPEPGQKALEGSKPISAVEETIRDIEHANGWIMLNHVERNPAYQQILETSICDVLEMGGRELKKKIKWFEAIIFITSPGRATSYHVDRECAWLLQLRGKKEIHLFRRDDTDVVPHEELEQFWSVDNSAGAYKPEYESRALVYPLRPGNGVHIPVNTPHWLKNGDNVSISMNLNFVFHDHLWGNIYKANHLLRKRGVNPRPPGSNRWIDATKSTAYTVLQRTNMALKRKPYIPQIAVAQKERIFRMMEDRW
ncbi:MAG TPA: hypothetical protein VGR96_10880 [Acidobacteriaceae bacterium]|nr:hypothetical protein [Acidobacteriaceae bacterium]